MITVDLRDTKLKENLEAIKVLKETGFYTNEELQKMYDEQVKIDRLTEANDPTEKVILNKELPKAIYQSFNSHDCETYYRCPLCDKVFGSWSYSYKDQECPICNKKIRIE